MGGIAGSSVVGLAADVPSAATLPAWILGTATVASENMTCKFAAEQVGQRRGCSLVRNVLDGQAIFAFQRFHEEMVGAAAAYGSVVVLAWIALDRVDHLLHGLRGKSRIGNQEEIHRPTADTGAKSLTGLIGDGW
jgi:hypothetical protein